MEPLPPLVCVDDYAKHARATMRKSHFDYVESGADEEMSLKDNKTAFQRWKLLPRILKDVSNRSLETTVLGHRIPFPICASPSGFQAMAHKDGEKAAAKALQSLNTIYGLSSVSTFTYEEVTAAAPTGIKFCQLNFLRKRDMTLQLLRRTEKCGFSAILLTVDFPVFGKRRDDVRNQFELPAHLDIANYAGYANPAADSTKSALQNLGHDVLDDGATWEDVKWLKTMTSLPIILKGVLTPEDAICGINAGVAAILVSNNGARQLDYVPATIDVLPSIVKAVAGRCEVYLDSGVRCGTDVFKALALGARAVFVGRPIMYGLAHDGEHGVRNVMEIMRDELSTAMALTGCKKLSDINRSLVIHERALFAQL